MRRATLPSGKAAGAGAAGVIALGLGLAVVLGALPADPFRFDGIEDLPLPGGADLGSHPYTVTAELDDVLSLVPQSAVKVNDVAVGRVTAIELGDGTWSARVTLKINGDVRLPADAGARLEQSSLLGEKYIQLVAPRKRAGAPLTDGSVIPLARTSRNTEVEEVFGALSLLLNGGGVNQLKTITRELNAALGGREPEVRSMLNRVNTLVTTLDAHRGDITRALDGVNRLSATLAGRKKDVDTVLTGLSPGLKTLENQRGSLLTMLRALDTLSGVAVTTVDASKKDMVADLKALAPTLTALADAGADLPDSLQVLLTYPFTDEVMKGIKGDYLNTYLHLAATPGTEVIPPLIPRSEPTPAPTTPAPAGRQRPATGGAARDGESVLPLPAVASGSTPGTGTTGRATPSKDGGESR
ncbi:MULTISPECIES: MCE family protein [unclassified Streptomyces]|uniref:MCE family protein n=1 Tax=unclassified Streptomyces TaxID=2593676 RepID=UPI0006F286A4|nr:MULTISPECIES: MCE family protein [unclassified Streptomyces]KQX57355.1 MCE-family lipoprotein LprK (MCE-family lipoprotein Mce1e) [Streptomyces sp. Root1304]KRA98727.1 MCE-family lipoprotein LprK (MCE-family lipoprotein Mce1e) [Streptomyces sp. Root66D1]